ncbi:hypothetical protein TNCV_1002431 [Trichonephila clavipes]|nr:hypothetical protein TNCV_1002431 [Trichonephila clavipes]
MPVETPISPPKKKLRSSIDSSNFDWEKSCFLCGQEADTEKEAKLNKNRRRQVSYINTSTLNDFVINFIAGQKNDCYRKIHKRISGITDLQALQAKYHADCYNLIKNFIHLSNADKKVAPRSLMIDTAMEQIYTYISVSQTERRAPLGGVTALQEGREHIEKSKAKDYFKKLLIY